MKPNPPNLRDLFNPNRPFDERGTSSDEAQHACNPIMLGRLRSRSKSSELPNLELAEVLAPTPPPKPLWDPTPPIPQNVPLAATSLTAKNLAELRREEDRREAEEIRELIAKTSKGDLTKVVWERRRSISKELEPELDLPEEPPMVKAPISKEAEDINKLVQEAEKARSNAGRVRTSPHIRV